MNRAFVITRSTQPNAKGVSHERVPGAGLDRDGCFDPSWYQPVDLRMFVPPMVEYVLDLTEQAPDVWAELLKQWEEL